MSDCKRAWPRPTNIAHPAAAAAINDATIIKTGEQGIGTNRPVIPLIEATSKSSAETTRTVLGASAKRSSACLETGCAIDSISRFGSLLPERP